MKNVSPLKVILFTLLVLPTAGLLFKLGLTVHSPALIIVFILTATVQLVPERSPDARGITQIIAFTVLLFIGIITLFYIPDGLSLTLKPWLGVKLLIFATMYGFGQWLIFSASIDDSYGKGEIIVVGFVVSIIFLCITQIILETLAVV